MPYERTIDIEIGEGILIRFSQSGRPIERLGRPTLSGRRLQTSASTTTIWAPTPARYTRKGVKQPERRSTRFDGRVDFVSNRPT